MSEPTWNEEARALLHSGDPAAQVDHALLKRVANRLARPQQRRKASRYALVAVGAVSIISGAALAGAAATQFRLRSTAPSPEPAPMRAGDSKRPAPVPLDTLGAESAMLREALASLAAGNLTSTLSTIEAYSNQFPNGAFAQDVEVIRARALVEAGREAEALVAFERLPSEILPANLALTWVHLLVRAGRCADASARGRALAEQSLTVQQDELRQELLSRCRVQGLESVGH